LKLSLDKKFIVKRKGKLYERDGYYIDNVLYGNIFKLQQQVKNKYDGIFALTGAEGTGKSTLAQMLAYTLDKDFVLENIVFSGQALIDRIEKCTRGQCIIYDEAITSLATSDASSDMQNTIIKVFTTIRSKGLYIILLLPNPFMLRRYFFIFRTKFLIHTYSTNGIDRGFFRFYSFKRKKLMYLRGWKEWDMSVVSPNFRGRFTNTEGYFINTEDYEKKKQDAIKEITQDKKTKEQQLKEQFEDAKLKLKINVEQWKEKYKNKVEEKFGVYKRKYDALNTKYKSKVVEDTAKEREINKELEDHIARVIYNFYIREKENYEQYKNETYTEQMFQTLIKNRTILKFKTTEITAYLRKGKDIAIIEESN
jgi:energy-coupling factor transporter ATP-binding protein EcfA2